MQNLQAETLRGKRGFTLMEMIIVLGLTAVLMLMLFVPLSRSLDLTQRASAKVQGQDNVRMALRRITRELSTAMEVYPPRPLRMWGYNDWTTVNNRPSPTPAAEPEPYTAPNAVIAFRLPKHRYYCIPGRHYVTPEDIDTLVAPGAPYDWVALGTCPRPTHAGFELELRPLQPMQPDERIVAYFVGLKDPGLQDASARPVYDNVALFRRQLTGAVNNMNTYALYRVEFDPRDPNLANWNLPDGSPNPDFFYDPTAAPNGLAYWQNWLSVANELMNVETGDVVRWVNVGGKYLPQPLLTVGPAPIEAEVAQPNRVVGQQLLTGVNPADLAAQDYRTEHGHWTGRSDDGLLPLPDLLQTAPVPTATVVEGPRVEVLAPDVNGILLPVFDSRDANVRGRLVTYDSVNGLVSMAIRRWDYAGNEITREYHSATLEGYYNVLLGRDVLQDPNGMPASFGAALSDPRFADTTMIVPGSETLQIFDPNGGTLLSVPLRRVGWTGLGPRLDRYVAQADLRPNEYSIDYRTGQITLSDANPSVWIGVGPGGARELLVKYQFQTNQSSDLVRVSYNTRELAGVGLGVVQYTQARSEVLPFEVSERVAIRNLKR